LERNYFDGSIYKLLFKNAAEGLIIVNKSGEIILHNPRAEEMFGYEPGELTDKNLQVLLPNRIKPNHQRLTGKYFDNPSKRRMGIGRDLEGKRKDGTHFPIEVSLNHFEYDGSTFAMALMTDITERKSTEEELIELRKSLEDQVELKTKALKDSQLLYKEVARNFPSGTINVLDEELNYVFVEGRELYKFGITSEKLVGTNYITGLPKSISKEIEEKFREVFLGQNQSFEVSLDKGDYLINTVGLKDGENNINQILVVEQDITRQKRAEKEVKRSLERERELGELKSRFVSMASHEFRTPLSTIMSSSSLALRYKDADQVDKREKHLKRIQSSVKNLTSILNDFLSLSKLEEGRISLNIESIDLEDLVKDLIDELQELKKPNQEFELNCSADSHIIVSDKNVIRNIFNNLFSNAIKYSPENTSIEINCSDLADEYFVSIKDKGIGIPLEEQMYLFERFFRAKNVSNIQGTGLGLNIVKRYVDLLQGSITFESEENRGTTFYLHLPKRIKNGQT
jgi:PAS domain S-box-containing protein